MAFNPWTEKGIPIEKQFENWSSLNVKPYDPKEVDPYTRTRGILMNGIETESVIFYHNFHRHTSDMELRNKLALIRRVEQQQQKAINWMIPAQESTLAVTIGYEQLAVDLTAAMAKKEPDPYVKATLDFALLEDFDHLYRYANLMLLTEGKSAEAIVKSLTEIMPGRPTVIEHRHPFDTVRNFYDKETASPITKLHVATITAAEQQTMNFYMNVGNRFGDTMGRSLYQEIAQIEEQHVTQYGSLADPRASWFEMAVLHEFNECYLYWSCMQSEPDQRIKGVWQRNLENELTHLQMAAEMMKTYEKMDPMQKFPSEFPDPLILESSKEYVREVLAAQTMLTANKTDFIPMSRMEKGDRFDMFQSSVNSGDFVPSQKVIMSTIQELGQDYRLQTEGNHPIDILNNKKSIPTRDQLVKELKSI